MEDFYSKWAKVLIHYSLNVQSGDYLVIAGDPEAMPLIDACFAEGVLTGAICDYVCLCGHHKEFLFENGSDRQLLSTPSLWHHAVQTCDKYLIITSSQNTRALAGVPQERHVLYSKGYKPILDTIFKRREAGELSWCLTQFPSPALAQEANMSTTAFAELTARASFLDQPDPIAAWETLKASQQRLADTLEKGKLLVFENDEGTHLEVNIDGMHWINHAASSNFPDGEVFTGPNLSALDGGVNGRVCVTFPTIMKQVEVRGIELTFERGAVVEAKATENETFLHAMIDQDPGARYVGEVALGTNYAISSGTKNILFDEKIGGTFHIALGKGYPETNNSNQSALHWDLVTDLRQSGRVFLDGKLISEKGRFLDPLWPSSHLEKS